MVMESSVKQTILELAIKTIDESGEPGIRVSQLAEAAGVAIPALYHHFGSREGLIEAAQVERFIRSLREDSEAFIARIKTCSSRDDVKRVVEDLVISVGTPERAQVRWRRMNAVGATYARPALTAAIIHSHEEMVDKLALSLTPLQRQGIIRQDIDLRAVVAWFNGSILGKNLVEIGNSGIDLDQWNRTLIEATFAVLFAD
jgi:AcrR family transcriptional regulator